MTIQLNSEGMLSGVSYHDSVVQSIRLKISGDILISYKSASGSNIVIELDGVYLDGLKISAGDIISEIFYWDKEALAKLPNGVWHEIFGDMGQDKNKGKAEIIEHVNNCGGLLKICCATQGSGSAVIKTIRFRETHSF